MFREGDKNPKGYEDTYTKGSKCTRYRQWCRSYPNVKYHRKGITLPKELQEAASNLPFELQGDYVVTAGRILSTKSYLKKLFGPKRRLTIR